MGSRRQFLGSIIYPAAAGAVLPRITRGEARFARPSTNLGEALAAFSGSPEQIARDESYWAPICREFTIDASVVNLNNGGVSPSPRCVQEAMKRHLDFCNSTPPPVALWRTLAPRREGVRSRLADQWGVDAEEVALTRNASESLEICQFGLDLKAGDEVIACTQDYPRMLTTFGQRARREGIVTRLVSIPTPCEDPSAIVRVYEQAVTPRTRLMLVSHVINITGQILPVREIVELGRRTNGGVPVIVDGAHALAHLDFRIPDLACDYYGVSLHKWLFAPHGTGMLYLRRDKIAGLWPLMAADEKNTKDIRKFEEIGTHPAANFIAIGEALTFNQAIGFGRKQARMRYLRDHWARRLHSHPSGRVKLHTSLKPEFSCGIATMQVDGLESEKLVNWLWDRHNILTVAIRHAEFEGVRVTPSVYTSIEQLDRFCERVEFAIQNGVPD